MNRKLCPNCPDLPRPSQIFPDPLLQSMMTKRRNFSSAVLWKDGVLQVNQILENIWERIRTKIYGLWSLPSSNGNNSPKICPVSKKIQGSWVHQEYIMSRTEYSQWCPSCWGVMSSSAATHNSSEHRLCKIFGSKLPFQQLETWAGKGL